MPAIFNCNVSRTFPFFTTVIPPEHFSISFMASIISSLIMQDKLNNIWKHIQ